MKRIVSIVNIIILVVIVLAYNSCNDQDAIWQEFLGDGKPLVYPGRALNAEALPGRGRVEISWQNNTDPNVNKARIYWNSFTDSIELDIVPGAEIIRKVIEPLPEDTYTFVIMTYDDKGNVSVPVEVTGAVYGEMYERSLVNRRMVSNQPPAFDKDEGVIKLQFSTANEYEKGIWVYHTNVDNDKNDSTWVEYSVTEPEIRIKVREPMHFRTVYNPGIDEFYAPRQRIWYTEGSIIDITEDVGLKNTSQPFEYDDNERIGAAGTTPTLPGGPRFARAMDWEYNDEFDGRRWTVSGNHYNTVDHAGQVRGPQPMLFTLDNTAGTTDIINGKKYQTVDMMPGSYEFVIKRIYQEPGSGDIGVYGAVATGDSLPDVDDLEEDALGYKQLDISNAGGSGTSATDIAIGFTLVEQGPVTLGFVVYFDKDTPKTNSGSVMMYFGSVLLRLANPLY